MWLASNLLSMSLAFIVIPAFVVGALLCRANVFARGGRPHDAAILQMSEDLGETAKAFLTGERSDLWLMQVSMKLHPTFSNNRFFVFQKFQKIDFSFFKQSIFHFYRNFKKSIFIAVCRNPLWLLWDQNREFWRRFVLKKIFPVTYNVLGCNRFNFEKNSFL